MTGSLRTRLVTKRGKKFKKAADGVENRSYGLAEAVELARRGAFASFDETVEIAIRLGVDPRHAAAGVCGL